MWRIQIDPEGQRASGPTTNRAKMVNGINGSPTSFMPGFVDLTSQFQELGFVNFRTHDLSGASDLDAAFDARRASNTDQLLVTVPDQQKATAKNFIADYANARVMFPNATDGMRRKNYRLAHHAPNFGPTDFMIRGIMDVIGAPDLQHLDGDVMFRVGRSADGGQMPPVDFEIYASLVERVVARYSKTPASAGLPKPVLYWEVWNEPDLPLFWNNDSPEQFYAFYSVVARRIKQVSPTAKVGGCGAAFGLNLGGPFLEGLLKYCRNTDTPLDFISWHFYPSETADPQNILDAADTIANSLDAYGFTKTESLCTEWNFTPYATASVFSKSQSAQNAAFVASTLIWMNACRVDKAYYLRGDSGPFGLFNDTPNPARPTEKAAGSYTAQTFYLYRQMLDMQQLVPTSDAGRTGVSILAGRSDNEIRILVANYRIDRSFGRMDTPPRGNIFYGQHYVDSGRRLEEIKDDWSREHWFGGADPTQLVNHNVIEARPLLPTAPIHAPYPDRTRDYSLSQDGVSLSLSNLADRIVTVTSNRIVEGGDLSSLKPPEASGDITVRRDGNDAVIEDSGAKEFTVTLYKVLLKG